MVVEELTAAEYCKMARNNNIRGNAKVALMFYSLAIHKNPLLSKAYFNRAITHEKLNRHEEALEDYTRAININPNYEKAYYFRGVLLSKMEQSEKAIRDFGKLLKIAPDTKLVPNIISARTNFDMAKER
jgi:tetratricopeptide (TPR) repeat protein